MLFLENDETSPKIKLEKIEINGETEEEILNKYDTAGNASDCLDEDAENVLLNSKVDDSENALCSALTTDVLQKHNDVSDTQNVFETIQTCDTDSTIEKPDVMDMEEFSKDSSKTARIENECESRLTTNINSDGIGTPNVNKVGANRLKKNVKSDEEAVKIQVCQNSVEENVKNGDSETTEMQEEECQREENFKNDDNEMAKMQEEERQSKENVQNVDKEPETKVDSQSTTETNVNNNDNESAKIEKDCQDRSENNVEDDHNEPAEVEEFQKTTEDVKNNDLEAASIDEGCQNTSENNIEESNDSYKINSSAADEKAEELKYAKESVEKNLKETMDLEDLLQVTNVKEVNDDMEVPDNEKDDASNENSSSASSEKDDNEEMDTAIDKYIDDIDPDEADDKLLKDECIDAVDIEENSPLAEELNMEVEKEYQNLLSQENDNSAKISVSECATNISHENEKLNHVDSNNVYLDEKDGTVTIRTHKVDVTSDSSNNSDKKTAENSAVAVDSATATGKF